jgi:hypothetical protein
VPALGAEQLVPLIDDDGAQGGEELVRALVAQRRERDSGVVMRTSGSRSRWRRRTEEEVSPVRLSTVMSASRRERGAFSASSMSRETARSGVM